MFQANRASWSTGSVKEQSALPVDTLLFNQILLPFCTSWNQPESCKSSSCFELSGGEPGPQLVVKSGGLRVRGHVYGWSQPLTKQPPTFVSICFLSGDHNSFFQELLEILSEQSNNKQMLAIYLNWQEAHQSEYPFCLIILISTPRLF